jgi:hypothetical protein
MAELLDVFHRDGLMLGAVQGGRQDAGGKDARGPVLKQIRHPFCPGQADGEAVPPYRCAMVVRLKRIVDPKAGGVVSGDSGDGQ